MNDVIDGLRPVGSSRKRPMAERGGQDGQWDAGSGDGDARAGTVDTERITSAAGSMLGGASDAAAGH